LGAEVLSQILFMIDTDWCRRSPNTLTENTTEQHNSVLVECLFEEGAAPVTIIAAAPKRQARMREKLAEYVSMLNIHYDSSDIYFLVNTPINSETEPSAPLSLCRYAPPHPQGIWPLTANILDPVSSTRWCQVV
jgi:hypothetical protein